MLSFLLCYLKFVFFGTWNLLFFFRTDSDSEILSFWNLFKIVKI